MKVYLRVGSDQGLSWLTRISVEKKDRKPQFQMPGSCNQRPERESERGWSGRERGVKGADESEGLLSLRPSCICGGRERSAHCNLRKDTQKASKTKTTYCGQTD